MTEAEYLALVDEGGGDALPQGHRYMFDDDPEGGSEWTMYCECGKWIEPGNYDHWDHLTAIGY